MAQQLLLKQQHAAAVAVMAQQSYPKQQHVAAALVQQPQQQTLNEEAAAVLMLAEADATKRGHGQVTPLHVAATLLNMSASSSPLRMACADLSSKSTDRLPHCRALELCFSIALERLQPVSASNSGAAAPPPTHSKALVTALKRAQAQQRRGCPLLQQQPFITVKIQLNHLAVSILDDPTVTRVMREAGFDSTLVKAHLLQLQRSGHGGVASTAPSLLPNHSAAVTAVHYAGSGADRRNLFLPVVSMEEIRQQMASTGQNLAAFRSGAAHNNATSSSANTAPKATSAAAESRGGCGADYPITAAVKMGPGPPATATAAAAILCERSNGYDSSSPSTQLQLHCSHAYATPFTLSLLPISEEDNNKEEHRPSVGVCVEETPIADACTTKDGLNSCCEECRLRYEKEAELLRQSLLRAEMEEEQKRHQESPPSCSSAVDYQLPADIVETGVNRGTDKSGGAVLVTKVAEGEAPRPLPPWLQNALNSFQAGSPPIGESTSSRSRAARQLRELQIKWNQICQMIHRHKYGGVTSSPSLQETAKKQNLNLNQEPSDNSNVNYDRQSRWAASCGNNVRPSIFSINLQISSGTRSAALAPTPNLETDALDIVPPHKRFTRQKDPTAYTGDGSLISLGLGCNTNNQNVISNTKQQQQNIRIIFGDMYNNDCTNIDGENGSSSLSSGSDTCRDQDQFTNSKAAAADKYYHRAIEHTQQSTVRRTYSSEDVEELHLIARGGGGGDMEDVAMANAEAFARLCKGLAKRMGRQYGIISTIASTVIRCRSGERRRRGGAWLLFLGHKEAVAKREMAEALSELVFGDGKRPICFSFSSSNTQLRRDEEDENSDWRRISEARRKLPLDQIVEAVKQSPSAVVLLENVEEADAVVTSQLLWAMQRSGRLMDSSGRDVNLSDAIVVMTSGVGRSYGEDVLMSRTTVEEKKRKRDCWWLQKLGSGRDEAEERGVGCRRLDLNVAATEEAEPTFGGGGGGEVVAVARHLRELCDLVDAAVVF